MGTSNRLEVQAVAPNDNARIHLSFDGDWKTFCGRTMDGWRLNYMPLHKAVHDPFICKRCEKEYWK